MESFKYIGKKIPRVDGYDKSTGRQKFMTDLKFPGLLYGKIIRAQYPHAFIKDIDYTEVLTLDGIVDVLTAKDIPGINAFGIEYKDQPVLCAEKVRYLGDPLALILGENESVLELGEQLIKVDYEQLPTIDTPEKALASGAPAIHEDGNILRRNKALVGNLEKAFSEAFLVMEKTYTTTWQEHAFLETEGGIAVPGDDGSITIYCPSQHGYRDRKQLADILNLPEEKIIVINSPVGGGFGGKDDINVQGLIALGALLTKRPVKIQLTREESISFGIKRQPFKIKMKTAVTENGDFLAHDVSVWCDTGPYASLGGAIMSFALENCCGAYYFPNLKLEGYCVYTNNNISGEFRGFGNNQIHFALESHLDLIAEKLNLDPVELRLKNIVKSGERHSHGHSLAPSIGSRDTLLAAQASNLWKNRVNFKQETSKPWLKRGVGIALCQHGNGIGKGIPDHSSASMEILENGKFQLAFSSEELGQGAKTTLTIIAAESLGISLEKIIVVNSNTAETPDSGSCTASRTTYITGRAIQKSINKLKEEIKNELSLLYKKDFQEIVFTENEVSMDLEKQMSLEDLGKLMKRKGKSKVVQKVDMPETDLEHDIGLHYLQSYLTQVVGVEVNTLTGKVDVLITEVFPDAGKVINLLGYEGQVEGGTVMGMGYTLMENFQSHEGKALSRNYQTYLIPTCSDCPEIRIHPIEVKEESGPYGAKGFGEITSIAITPAIINAIYDAIGVRVSDLPADPERIYKLLKNIK